jgi:hypothetical protein
MLVVKICGPINFCNPLIIKQGGLHIPTNLLELMKTRGEYP